MTNDEKIASAKAVLKQIAKAQKALDKAKQALLDANELAALDPSGEAGAIGEVIVNINTVIHKVNLEDFRWATYLDNRE